VSTTAAVLAASTYKSAGYVIAVVVFLGFFVYLFINVRKGRAEVGSEIELAPNRKPYYDDEQLEGKVLDRALTWGLILLGIIALTLPLYWLAEPGRQDGAIDDFNRKFTDRGSELFATTEDGGLNCAGCHGPEGVGGAANFTITDPNGEFVEQVQWQAPALNTVLWRFDEEEVRDILIYGRPFSPMPAWGVEGGGPLNEQQIQNLIDYIESIQVDIDDADVRDELRAEVDAAVEEEMAAAEEAGVPYSSRGQALFNLGYYTNYAGGAYACGRCHTTGWSYDDKGPDGNGALGPSLRGGVSTTRFPGVETGFQQQVDFVCTGSEKGVNYGQNSQGSGRMPGFCQTPAEVDNVGETGEVGVAAREPSDPDTVGGMLSKEDVEEIVRYVRGL
jgi:mono/diheme cytochrome c family protein